MQSGWAIGYAAAVLVSGFVQPRYGWRAVFFVGILPALLHALGPAQREGAGDLDRRVALAGADRAGVRCRSSRAASPG